MVELIDENDVNQSVDTLHYIFNFSKNILSFFNINSLIFLEYIL